MTHWLWLVPFSLLGFGIGWSVKGLFVEREEDRTEEARWTRLVAYLAAQGRPGGDAMTDEQDRPEPEAMTLVVPFIVCTSKGGPYDDASFVAGFQAARVDHMLEVAALVCAERVAVPFVVRTDLVPQLELLGMHRGFPVIEAAEVTETPEYQAMPEWSFVTFATTAEEAP